MRTIPKCLCTSLLPCPKSALRHRSPLDLRPLNHDLIAFHQLPPHAILNQVRPRPLRTAFNEPLIRPQIPPPQTLQRMHADPAIRPLHDTALIPIHALPHAPKHNPIIRHQRAHHRLDAPIRIPVAHLRFAGARVVGLATHLVEKIQADKVLEIVRRKRVARMQHM